MFSNSQPKTNEALDQLLLDCAELESLMATMKTKIAKLDPAVESGRITAEHLLKLVLRIEAAERGMIDIAHHIDSAATNITRRHERMLALH